MPSTLLSPPSVDAANLATLGVGGPFAFDLDLGSSPAQAFKSVTIADAALREAVGRAYRAAQAYQKRLGAPESYRASAQAPCALRGPPQQQASRRASRLPAYVAHAQAALDVKGGAPGGREEQAAQAPLPHAPPAQSPREPLQHNARTFFAPHAVRQVLTYQDEPATCSALAQSLAHYRYFLGEVKSFSLGDMAAIGLPLVVWQNIFSRAKKRVELGQPLRHPAAYCLEAGRRERAFVRCRKGPLASAPIFKPRTFVGTPAGSGRFRALSTLLG